MRRFGITGWVSLFHRNNTQEVAASLHEAKSGITRADKYAEARFPLSGQARQPSILRVIDRADGASSARRGRDHVANGPGAPDSSVPAEVSKIRTASAWARAVLVAYYRWRPRHHPYQGTRAVGPVAVPTHVVDGIGTLATWFNQGRELFHLLGLRHLDLASATRLRNQPERSTGHHFRRRFRKSSTGRVGAVRRHGAMSSKYHDTPGDRRRAPRTSAATALSWPRRGVVRRRRT